MQESRLARFAVRLERAAALDHVVAPVRRAVRRLIPEGPLADLLHGVPLGHPAHPLMVTVPIGAWSSAAVFDLMPGGSKTARTLVGIGLLGALPSAAAGAADWTTLGRSQLRVGLVHAIANDVGIACYAVSYLERRRGRTARGKLFALVGLSVLSVGGYLGGHLTYRQAARVVSDEGELDPAPDEDA